MNNFFVIVGIIIVGLVLVAFSSPEIGNKENSIKVEMGKGLIVILKKIKLDGTTCIVAENNGGSSISLSCDWSK